MFGYADVTEFNVPGDSLAASIAIQGTNTPGTVKGVTGIFNLKESDLQGAVIGVDTNAGFAFRLAQNVLLSTRYRLFYLSPPKVRFEDGGYFIHGPEVNATITW
jgi:hypothetical protein